MDKRKLIISQNLSQDLLEAVEALLPDWTIICGRSPEIWLGHLHDVEVIAGWKKEMVPFIENESVNKLKWVQTWSAGVNALPLHTMEKLQIKISTATGVHAYPISESIFALMLALTRKLDTYVKQQKKKVWHHAYMNQEIHNKTIGIIGVGKIGKETAKIAKAFNMRVLGIRRSGLHAENVDEMFTPEQISHVLPQCDYVVVTLPLTEDTKGMFGADEFSLMKKTAYFINIGRGPIVKEKELISALHEGKIAGAGLDVFEKEPLSVDSPLWDMENVIITPHTSGNTEFYDKRLIEDIFLPNLASYLQDGVICINGLDYQKGY